VGLTLVPLLLGEAVSVSLIARAFEHVAGSETAELAEQVRMALFASAATVPVSLGGLVLLIVGLVRYFRRR
jgi:hypothetical protein